jgi:hypothetical protein
MLDMCMCESPQAQNSPQAILAALGPAQADRRYHFQDFCNAVSELHVTSLRLLLLLLLLLQALLQPQWGMQRITPFCCGMGKSKLQATQAPVATPPSYAAGTARYITRIAPKAAAPISPFHRSCWRLRGCCSCCSC